VKLINFVKRLLWR